MTTRYNGSFLDWLRQRASGALSLQESAHFVRQAADALQSVHNQRIVYQNVNPANFLIRGSREHSNLPNLQLADSGSPTSVVEPPDTNRPVTNSPLYVAPEQWQGISVLATDQYALAVMAYQLLTWHALFQGTQEQIMQQHLHVQPQPPSTFSPVIPPALDAVVLCALAKKPQDRYPSVSAFANAFEQALQAPNSVPLQGQAAVPNTNLSSFSPAASNSATREQAAPVSNPSGTKTSLTFPSQHSQIRELLLALVFIVVISGIGFGFYTITKNNQVDQDIRAAMLIDSLSSNTNGRWLENATCVFKGGAYHVVKPQTKAIQRCIAGRLSFGNIAIQVDVSLLAGDIAGLIFRAHSRNGHSSAYLFIVSGLQGFTFARSNPDRVIITHSAPMSVIAPGNQKNTLLVIAQGSDFKLYINGTLVGEVQDNAFASGQIGFTVAAVSAPHAEASFSNLKLFKLYQLATPL